VGYPRVAAVLFVGLVFGALDPVNFVIPEVIYVLGLILSSTRLVSSRLDLFNLSGASGFADGAGGIAIVGSAAATLVAGAAPGHQRAVASGCSAAA